MNPTATRRPAGRRPDRSPPRCDADPPAPDWARRSAEDLLRYLYVCPSPGPALDELLRR